MSSALSIEHLSSGGLITNYYCSSRCGHCLYACSPRWDKQYITQQTVQNNLDKVRQLGCYAVHIGGGEPFMDVEGLCRVLQACSESGVHVEYVETNSSWFRSHDQACKVLASLLERGLGTLLISMDPFHNQYVPFNRVKGVLKACAQTGMNTFPWVANFYNELDSLAQDKVHKISEYESTFGPEYVQEIPGRYWVHFGGRAVYTFAPFLETHSVDAILEQSCSGCSELADVSHFHMDLFGGYVPGLCSGMSIKVEDLGKPLDNARYPYIMLLYEQGIKGLLEKAQKEFGYETSERFISKCHLCVDIRRYLVKQKNISSPDLGPRAFYENLEPAAQEVK